MECFIKTFVTSSPVPFLRIEYVSLFTQTNFSLRYCLYFIPLSIFHQLKFNLIRRYKMFRLNFNPSCLPSISKGNIKFFNSFQYLSNFQFRKIQKNCFQIQILLQYFSLSRILILHFHNFSVIFRYVCLRVETK